MEGKQYWAKGTGFGTGSFNSKWNMKETVTKQQQEEALVTILFEVRMSSSWVPLMLNHPSYSGVRKIFQGAG